MSAREGAIIFHLVRAAWVFVCVGAAVAFAQVGDTPAEREARVREQISTADGLYLQNKPAEALEAYAEARRLCEGRAPLIEQRCRAVLAMGDCLRLLDRPAEARAAYLDILAAGATCSQASKALLRAGQVCQWELDDPQAARAHYEQLLADYPAAPQARSAALYAAAMLEYEGRFDEALKAYDALMLKYASDPAAAAVVEKAQAAWRFLKTHRGEDDAPLAIFRRSQRLARREETRNAALLELINLTGHHADSPLVDNALVLMIRTYLAKDDRKAARETFDRLVKVGPTDLTADEVRFVAPHAAGWLLGDLDAQIQRVAEVFPELAGYGRSDQGWRIPSMVSRNADDQWTIVYDTAGALNSARRLSLRIVVGPVARGKAALYPALGLHQEVAVDTPNDVLKQDILGGVQTMSAVLRQLDRAAYVPANKNEASSEAPTRGATASRP